MSLIDKSNYSRPTILNNIYLDSLIGAVMTGMIIVMYSLWLYVFFISKSVIALIIYVDKSVIY